MNKNISKTRVFNEFENTTILIAEENANFETAFLLYEQEFL